MATTDSREQTTYPSVPSGDTLDAASAVFNEVLECVAALQDDLHIIASRHVDSAPVSSIHVLDFNAALARAVLEWIGRWPT